MPPTDSERITIATSLVPGRRDRVQHTALTSWTAAGFYPISVNVAEEIASLRTEFPTVAFVTASRSGRKIAGKPVPFITDLLKAADHRHDGPRLIGLFNADIILRPGTRLAETLTAEAGGTVVMVPRVDIPSLDAATSFPPTGNHAFSVGYDGAFLDTSFLAALPDNAFCLGMPFWDYWLPMMALLQDRPLKSIASAEALHVSHDTAWDQTIYFYFHALVSDLITECRRRGDAKSDPALALLSDVMANIYTKIFDRGTGVPATPAEGEARRAVLADAFDSVQEVVVQHIKRRAEPLLCPRP